VNNEPLARRLQHVLAPQVSQICSQKIKPTFSTSMRYEASSDLSPHRDREQAWLTMTLQLSKKKKDAWSFCVESRNQSNQNQSYLMQNGDAVLFEGETLQHWRERMPANDSCLMMCMHFAKETYNGFYR
jgi:alkylated DNA repair dioxygenase AlkB